MELVEGYRPGLLSGLVGLHLDYYARAWGFGLAFEAKVAREAALFLEEFDAARDLMLSVWEGDRLAATIAIDGSERDGPGNHLRWFIVADAARRHGLGRRLMVRAMGFCDASPHELTWLTTFAGLDVAAALYRTAGFTMTSEAAEDQWQGGVREQRWERR